MAKGLEKAIFLIADFVTRADAATKVILYGGLRQRLDGTVIYDPKNPIDRTLSLGLVGILKKVSNIDFCNLLSYLASSIGGGGFNPNKKPEGGVGLGIWLIQNEAYKLQLEIDKNLGEIGDVINQDSVLRLSDLINFMSNFIDERLTIIIDKLLSDYQNRGPISDDEYKKLNKTFRRLIFLKIGLEASSGALSTIGSNLQVASFKKGINAVNKVRSTLVLIQAISNPAAALALVNQLSGGAIQKQVKELEKLIPINKLVPFLKKSIEKCNNINSTGQKILGQIKTIQFYVQIAITIIKILSALKFFFKKSFQLPNLYTTTATTTTVSSVVEESLNQNGIKKLELRLEQINFVLGLLYSFANTIVTAINEILISLNAILLNIQNCQNVPDELKNDLSKTVADLTETRNGLQEFINNVNQATRAKSNTFGGYVIEIISEETVDEGIGLRRRFGIARGLNGVIDVQSTPTFASLDLIIINEVKSLLVAKGLVKVQTEGLDTGIIETAAEALKYLGDESLTIDGIDSIETEVDDESVDQGEFVDNLPGGRKLRIKVRRKLIKGNQSLIENLRKADPTSTDNTKLVNQKKTETIKILESQIKDYQKVLKSGNPVLILSFGGAVAILSKIKGLEQEIKDLKKG